MREINGVINWVYKKYSPYSIRPTAEQIHDKSKKGTIQYIETNGGRVDLVFSPIDVCVYLKFLKSTMLLQTSFKINSKHYWTGNKLHQITWRIENPSTHVLNVSHFDFQPIRLHFTSLLPIYDRIGLWVLEFHCT